VEAYAQGHKINTDNKQWAKCPNALSRRLRSDPICLKVWESRLQLAGRQ
jgi:hypothetical protein